MEKKISIKNIYLLFVTCFGLIGLGLGSTYAVFVASASIDNPITLVSNLSYENKVMEIIEVEVDEYEIESVTLNINNTNDSTINYTTWVAKQGDVDMNIATSSGNPSGTLEEGDSTTVTVDIMNNTSESVKVTLGVSQGNTITLGKDMQTVPSESFTTYAVYSSDDNSLTFYNTLDTITKDEIYNGKTVTDVYTGFGKINYNEFSYNIIL